MKNTELENILLCAINQRELIALNSDEVARLKARIVQGEIKGNWDFYKAGAIQGAFQVKDQDSYYLVIDHIIYLLPEFLLTAISNPSVECKQTTKNQVKQFYDDFGWQQSEGVYQDAQDSEDLREVSKEYILQCHLRLNKHLPRQGQYLLDIASGPVQYPAYLTYSQQFDYRICADISLRALQEAKKKLGEKGIYLLCDVTQLPLKTNAIDAIVSLHTLYHVPEQEQSTAFSELYRVLKLGGKSVIVYSWGSHSLLMNIALLPCKVIGLFKRMLVKFNKLQSQQNLYFHAHPYRWFKTQIASKYETSVYSWRSVNVPFLKIFIHQKWGGKTLLRLIFWLENRYPTMMGRLGAYPIFVTIKN